jgi:argininosuccinate lyase
LKMLTRARLVRAEESRSIRSDILKLGKMGPTELKLMPETGDLFKNREKWFKENSPSRYGWVSTGRARREVNTIAFHLLIREMLADLTSALLSLCDDLTSESGKYRSVLFPDYTYTQPAQPGTFGHYLMSFVSPLIRDLQRLQSCLERVNQCPGGIGSTNGSPLPLDRTYLAKVLGFSRAVLHARDAMWLPDIPVEVLSVLTSICLTISRFSDDFHVWGSEEFGYVSFAPLATRKSVIMPQKNNPYLLSFARGLFAEVLGRLNGVAVAGRTATGQIDNRLGPYVQVPAAIEATNDGVRILRLVISGLRPNIDRMKQRAEESAIGASDLVDLLICQERLDHPTAYQIVQEWVALSSLRGAAQTGPGLAQLQKCFSSATGRGLSLSLKQFRLIFSPARMVESRKGLGGASPPATLKVIVETKKQLREIRLARDLKYRKIKALEKKLLSGR